MSGYGKVSYPKRKHFGTYRWLPILTEAVVIPGLGRTSLPKHYNTLSGRAHGSNFEVPKMLIRNGIRVRPARHLGGWVEVTALRVTPVQRGPDSTYLLICLTLVWVLVAVMALKLTFKSLSTVRKHIFYSASSTHRHN